MVPAIKSLKLDYMPYSLSIDHIFKVLMEHNCKVTVSSLKLLCACVCMKFVYIIYNLCYNNKLNCCDCDLLKYTMFY